MTEHLFPPEVPLRDEIAVVLHKLFCDQRCDSADSPCWTAWRQEADLVMIPVQVALAEAWRKGALSGARGFAERRSQNPYTHTRPTETCACGWDDQEHDPREHSPRITNVLQKRIDEVRAMHPHDCACGPCYNAATGGRR